MSYTFFMGSTIEDIAKAAGVSTATVSRAINEPDRVRPETRKKIEEVILAEGYKPNIFARGLMKSSTDSVGILVSYITNPYITSMINAAESTLAKNGTYIYLCNCNGNKQLERKYAEELLRRNVDALIVAETPSLNSADNFFLSIDAACPLILINEHVAAADRHFIVRCDQVSGFNEALNLFMSRGSLPIALLSSNDSSYSFALKESLFAQFREKHGLSAREAVVYHIGDTNDESIVGRTAERTLELLSGPDRPRAILAGNDLIALGVLEAARELGVKIPDDLAVIGVDNTFLSRISFPPLSAIDLRAEVVGRMAAELYLRLRAGRAEVSKPFCETISSFLCLRSST